MKLLASLIVATSISFAAGAGFGGDHQADIKADLHAFNDRFNEYAANYNIDGLVSLYADDSLWIAPKTRPTPGKEGAIATFSFMQAKNGTNVHSVDKLVISDDGTLAVIIGSADIVVAEVGLDFTGTYQFVLQHDGTDWNIMSDMYNVHEDAN